MAPPPAGVNLGAFLAVTPNPGSAASGTEAAAATPSKVWGSSAGRIEPRGGGREALPTSMGQHGPSARARAGRAPGPRPAREASPRLRVHKTFKFVVVGVLLQVSPHRGPAWGKARLAPGGGRERGGRGGGAWPGSLLAGHVRAGGARRRSRRKNGVPGARQERPGPGGSRAPLPQEAGPGDSTPLAAAWRVSLLPTPHDVSGSFGIDRAQVCKLPSQLRATPAA